LASLHHQVFFCTPAPGINKQITFRPPREEDYLGSYLRQHVFQHLFRQELSFGVILGRANEDYDPATKILLTDDDNPLSEWQDESASHHWQCESIGFKYIPLSPPWMSVTSPVHWLLSLGSVLNDEPGGRPSSFSPPASYMPSDDLKKFSDERSFAGYPLGNVLKRVVGKAVEYGREAQLRSTKRFLSPNLFILHAAPVHTMVR